MADAFVTKVEGIGTDIVKGIEEPFKFVVKAVKVLDTAIKDQPELKSVLTTLVQKVEEVGGLVGADVTEKGLNLQDDANTLTAIEALFTWFKATVVPVIESVYNDVKTDLSGPNTLPGATTTAAVPATT